MTENNRLALIVAYYLSRADKVGWSSLGYSNFEQAIKEIGNILDVKPNTIKNMRDEFDPFHENPRIGWQRELRGSRAKVLKAFQETDDDTLLEIVRELLFSGDFRNSEEQADIDAVFADKESRTGNQKATVYVSRGPTGRKAEDYFKAYFESTGEPSSGELIDRRDEGCGYDFEIKSTDGSHFVEVKGLSGKDGGILFTNKEWKTAIQHRKRYYLVLVRNVSTKPEVTVIQDPAAKLRPNKNVYTTVQLNWSVPIPALKALLPSSS